MREILIATLGGLIAMAFIVVTTILSILVRAAILAALVWLVWFFLSLTGAVPTPPIPF